MPPRVDAPVPSEKSSYEQSTHDGIDAVKKLKLSEIRQALPADVFNKSLPLSLFYLAFDISVCIVCFYLMYMAEHSTYWNELNIVTKCIAWLIYWNVTGFFMWCLFVVGHDCGHGTFSEYTWVNDIIGHLSHGALLVPYFPWQLTHRRHHMYHNHLTKDYSHAWYTEEHLNAPDQWLYRFFREHKDLMATFPLFGWAVYLFGLPDGNHFLPIPSQRMWKESNSIEYVKCILSTLVVCLYAYFFFSVPCGGDKSSFVFYYFIPNLVFGWWLVCVTYLQHHCPSTVVYDNDTWNFLTAAFETVDRSYGYGIDDLSHNITDGHVVHHLFYTKIPHYHLKKATIALQNYLLENNAHHLYKREDTFDFYVKVHKYFRDIGFGAKVFKEDIQSHIQKKEKSIGCYMQ